MSKITIEEQKDLKIKLKEPADVETTKFHKDKEIKATLKKRENIDISKLNDKDTVEGDFELELVANKDNSDITGDSEEKKTAKVKAVYKRGWISNSLLIKKVGDKDLDGELSVSAGGDFWGMNWGAWTGLVVIIIAVVAIGWYWWTSSQENEEESEV